MTESCVQQKRKHVGVFDGKHMKQIDSNQSKKDK